MTAAPTSTHVRDMDHDQTWPEGFVSARLPGWRGARHRAASANLLSLQLEPYASLQ